MNERVPTDMEVDGPRLGEIGLQQFCALATALKQAGPGASR